MNHHNHRESRIENPVIYVPIRHLYICREPSTNQLLFMQNKPNFAKAKMNINIYHTKAYNNETAFRRGKNKPNSNPIKANFRKVKMNVNLTLTKDYRKKDDFVVRINKPNFRNGQNERKLNFNKGLQKKRLFSSPKNKPKTKPISSKAKIAFRKIRPHPRTRSLTFRWGSHSIIPCLIGRTMLCNDGSS